MIRAILELSSRRNCGRFQSSIIRQAPLYLSSRNEFSTTSQQKAPSKPGTSGQPPETGGSSSKFVIAGLAIAAACTAAYLNGSFGKANVDIDGKAQKGFYNNAKSFPSVRGEKGSPIGDIPKGLNQEVDTTQESRRSESLGENKNEVTHHADAEPEVTLEENKVLDQVTEPSSTDPTATTDQNNVSGISPEGSHDVECPTASSEIKAEEEVQITQSSSDGTSIAENITTPLPHEHLAAADREEDSVGKGEETSSSLLEAYHLRDGISHSPVLMNSHDEIEKAFASSIEDLNDAAAFKDGKLILDFLQAIHAAEKRQAELDSHSFAEEKRAMKEKYEKELKDAIARQLMHAEEAALLDKELKRERAKAVAALKSLQERLEEKYKTELEQKEDESELKLKKAEELAKAEMVAAIAREKASQIEKMAEADLHINALCMAFYARSEEARRSHSVHKLALGALALEDALTKGLPIKAEINALQTYLEGVDKGSMLDLVISSLPEETITYGSDTVLQLNQQFDVLKDTLRHYSLIPPGGGGILAHSLAHVASWLKVKEADRSGDGIESVISRVDGYLKEGRLAEAADALEEGVQGSQAAEIVHSWVRQARNRAIAEQALTLLQSYATAVSLT